MTGDGSAIMHVLGKDSPYEMVTMIHPDGKRLLATHYCAAHNQPRMALAPSAAANEVAFTFIDGTNIAPGDQHMRGVVFTFIDADHHEERWTSSGSSTTSAGSFMNGRLFRCRWGGALANRVLGLEPPLLAQGGRGSWSVAQQVRSWPPLINSTAQS